MSADLSRVRFDPLRDFSGIGIQQGRVWLDADFNEQVAITDRRLRAQVVDLAPAPTVVSRQTPDAFRITLSGGKMSIGAGRMYIDGLLAENHGGTTVFDPVLAESNGTGGVKYGKQPYWPSPAKLPDSGPHLVYLDVWERERTHLNTPDLVDSAIGVDTTTRAQIVWQVRVLPNVGANATCGSAIKAWDELIAPSPLRLTTGTEAVDPVTDPCDIPPGTGYRGPENQLYRIEVHSPTQFKWSRDNATGSAVAEVVSATSLRLHSLGRDDVLSIKDNDWVEITDDARELSQAAGEMREVTVDVATSTITFSPALPAELTNLDNHLRVRKWDSPLVTIPTDGSAVSLEHGITVTFSSKGSGKPRPGDYWVFAARVTAPTPDESLEKLVETPPRGIHHHYARLALITLPGTAHDCRPDWPVVTGDGCGCEICITPEQHNEGVFTIQDAVEKLQKAGGGTITLCPGTYQLEKPVELNAVRSIRLRGSGRSTRLESSDVAVIMTKCRDVVLEDFSIGSAGGGPGIVLAVGNEGVALERLWVKQLKGPALGLAGVQTQLRVHECVFASLVGISAVAWSAGRENNAAGLFTWGLSIRDTVFHCDQRGIDLDIERGAVVQHTGRTSISGNIVMGCENAGIVMTGLVPQDVKDLDGTLDICANTLEVSGAGIVTGGHASIRDNTVTCVHRRNGRYGILIKALPPDAADRVVSVTGNSVAGFAESGITVTAPTRSLVVQQNVIRRTGGGVLVHPKRSGKTVAVYGNQIVDLRPFTGEGEADTLITVNLLFTAGILVVGMESIAIADNTIDGMGAEQQDAIHGHTCVGIAVVGCREGRISSNTLSRIGPPDPLGNSYGIFAGSWQDTVSIADNMVRCGAAAQPVARPGWAALSAILSAGFTFAGMRMARSAAGAWVFAGDGVYLQDRLLGHLEVTGNTLHGGGEATAASMLTSGEVVMSANRCTQPGEGEQPVVRLKADVAIVQGNRLIGGRPSMVIDVDVEAASVQGNISTGGIQIAGTEVENTGKPWSSLNPIA